MTVRRLFVPALVAIGCAHQPATNATPMGELGSPRGWVSLPEAERDARVAALQTSPLTARVVALSESFLGTPYVLSPLGEGQGRDSDPLVRYDAVDCVTLVEEVMAMTLAPDATSRIEWLNRIRYAGAPAWETRNHIIEAQWLPNNLAQGYLREVTAQYAGEQLRTVTKVLTAETWSWRHGVEVGLPEAVQPRGTFSLNVVPADAALEALSVAPSGLVVVVVHVGRSKAVTRVSHMGLLIQTPTGPVLRHASSSFNRVVDEPLGHYLNRNIESGKSTIEGLALYAIKAPFSE